MRGVLVVFGMVVLASAGAARAQIEIEQPKEPIALARGGSGGICHCPCRSGSCDCTMHSETCHRCYDLTVNLNRRTLAAILGSGEAPILEASNASWFEASPHPELKVRLEATMKDSGQPETLEIRFVPDPVLASRYVPDKTFDATAYAAWTRRVDRGVGAALTVGAKDDPGTWRILDGDANRLNQSLEKSFRLVRQDGSHLEVFRSESTLGWEANLYLRAVVAGIPDDALRGNPTQARSDLLSLLDLVDLQMKAGDPSGAIRSLDGLIESGKSRWLDAEHEDTAGALCGFRKIRNLLVPGSSCS